MTRHIVPARKAGDPAAKGLFESIDAALESIRRRAYELFRLRGSEAQNHLDDWFRAERELFEVPPSELTETGDAFVVTVAVPGYEADQLQVAIDDRSLTIQGQAEKRREKTGEKQIFSELTRKELFRRFTLPAAFDADKVRANLADERLKVTLPKMVEPSAVETQAA
jgi:HSP20 family protein